MTGRVLIVEDRDSGRTLRQLLHEGVLPATWVRDGCEALRMLREAEHDLVVLDIDLGSYASSEEPPIDGLQVLREIRTNHGWNLPVMMLSRIGLESVKVMAFELGADDFVTKPFGPRELVARARRLLHRHRSPTLRGTDEGALLCIDAAARRVTLDAVTLELTPTEFDLLVVLARHGGRVLSREQILCFVREGSWVGDPRVVDSHVRNLRRKLDRLDHSGPRITTVRHAGYRLDGRFDLR